MKQYDSRYQIPDVFIINEANNRMFHVNKIYNTAHKTRTLSEFAVFYPYDLWLF